MTTDPTGRATTQSKPQYVLAALMAAAIFAPDLQAQNPAQTGGRTFDILAGVRVEHVGVLSPGLSVQVNWEPPRHKATWMGMQLHTQLIRFFVDEQIANSDKVRRDYHVAARLKAGFGRGDGPVFYGFAESGVGVIGTQPEAKRGDMYLLSGIGVGAGLTLLPFTFAVEGSMATADRPPNADVVDSFVMTLQYRLP